MTKERDEEEMTPLDYNPGYYMDNTKPKTNIRKIEVEKKPKKEMEKQKSANKLDTMKPKSCSKNEEIEVEPSYYPRDGYSRSENRFTAVIGHS